MGTVKRDRALVLREAGGAQQYKKHLSSAITLMKLYGPFHL